MPILRSTRSLSSRSQESADKPLPRRSLSLAPLVALACHSSPALQYAVPNLATLDVQITADYGEALLNPLFDRPPFSREENAAHSRMRRPRSNDCCRSPHPRPFSPWEKGVRASVARERSNIRFGSIAVDDGPCEGDDGRGRRQRIIEQGETAVLGGSKLAETEHRPYSPPKMRYARLGPRGPRSLRRRQAAPPPHRRRARFRARIAAHGGDLPSRKLRFIGFPHSLTPARFGE